MNFLKKNYTCIGCWETVTNEDEIYQVGLEIPYMNLYLHRACYRKIQNNILEYLKENLEKYIKIPKK